MSDAFPTYDESEGIIDFGGAVWGESPDIYGLPFEMFRPAPPDPFKLALRVQGLAASIPEFPISPSLVLAGVRGLREAAVRGEVAVDVYRLTRNIARDALLDWGIELDDEMGEE